ncbi:hypothetical protein DRE_02712 [Drechslerella stenobrocha 248]|uniref:Histidine phosphatase superfamily n=1 Tax=Drechslerella stenobrocha 248 TaxID=1043628 RepID=W7I740_9PEZI|nr:hypothetical protein DRE_02712 [Drechslerella stenobrocha 248]
MLALRSRRHRRLLSFVAAFAALYYVISVLLQKKPPAISPLVFSGRPPTKLLAPRRKNLKLESVNGFFLQGLSETNQTAFNVFHADDFGLIEQEYSIFNRFSPGSSQWDLFQIELARMNQEVTVPRLGVRGYKVLYLFRPPESWHHTGEAFYGKESWDCLWTRQDGNGTAKFIDADLTPNGIHKAKYVHSLWDKRFGESGAAVPELFLSSPLSRAAETLTYTFDLASTPPPSPPIFVEYLRESFGVDTHNSRRSLTYLKKRFPLFEFEEDFSEFDPLWTSNRDETEESTLHRAKIFLENLFLRRSEAYVAIATHENVIKAILEAIGHRPFAVPVGHMIPVVVKGSWFKSYETRTEMEKVRMHYKRDRNCTILDPVTDPDAEPEEDDDQFEMMHLDTPDRHHRA